MFIHSLLVLSVPLGVSLVGPALAEQPAQTVSKPASCPYGFYRSGERCLSTPGSTRKAVKRVGGTCPLGWFSAGAYCVRER